MPLQLLALVIIIAPISCKKSSDSSSAGTATVPDVYKKIYGATSITSDGTYITIKTNGSPDYKSVYYPDWNSLGAGWYPVKNNKGTYTLNFVFHYGSLVL